MYGLTTCTTSRMCAWAMTGKVSKSSKSWQQAISLVVSVRVQALRNYEYKKYLLDLETVARSLESKVRENHLSFNEPKMIGVTN